MGNSEKMDRYYYRDFDESFETRFTVIPCSAARHGLDVQPEIKFIDVEKALNKVHLVKYAINKHHWSTYNYDNIGGRASLLLKKPSDKKMEIVQTPKPRNM